MASYFDNFLRGAGETVEHGQEADLWLKVR